MSKLSKRIIVANSLKLYLAVGIGGMFGAILRYSFSLMFVDNCTQFPWATLTVNLLGSFMLPYLFYQEAIRKKVSHTILTALTTGMIGAFTTFSTLTIDVLTLWQNNIILAFGYMFLTFFGGLLLSFGGYKIAYK